MARTREFDKRLALRMTAALYAQYAEIAEEMGMPVQMLIREMLEAALPQAQLMRAALREMKQGKYADLASAMQAHIEQEIPRLRAEAQGFADAAAAGELVLNEEGQEAVARADRASARKGGEASGTGL